jgi:type IV pilus assembly protein PilM
MEPDELAEYIMTEAEQYIPFDIDDVYLDFQDLHTGTKDSARTDVMLVAAKKEVVNAYLDMLAKIGLKTVVVDVDAFALENSYEKNFSLSDNVALIDIGASKMSINIISGGMSILARDVVLGSRQVTDQIQSRFDLSFEEAEELKIGLVPAEDKKTELEGIFVNVCTQWILEIKKALDFYFSSYPDESISRLVLSGGGAKVKGLDKFLSDETGIPTEIFNPFTNIEVNTSNIDPQYIRQIAPEMAISAGLATRPSSI